MPTKPDNLRIMSRFGHLLEIVQKEKGLLNYIGKLIFPINLIGYETINNTKIIFGLISISIITLLLVISKQKKTVMVNIFST